jgi:hypothetical protein
MHRLTFLLLIREIVGSQLNLKTDYPEALCRFLSPSTQMLEQILKT